MPTDHAIRERPILFSGSMVRAILDGRKTQTRRVIKQPWKIRLPEDVRGDWPVFHETVAPAGIYTAERNPHGAVSVVATNGTLLGIKPNEYEHISPYETGMRLWVRETWQYEPAEFDPPLTSLTPVYPERVWYRADMKDGDLKQPWRPSIYMPRWASRITLEVTAVRVERVQDITEADAIAEGAQCPGVPASLTNRGAFAKLWDTINAKRGYSWKSNPWVWVVEFRRIANAA